MSAASARLAPYPVATPSTAAMTGFGMRRMARMTGLYPRSIRSPVSAVAASFKSAPEEKAPPRAGQDDGAHGRVLARRRQPAVEAGDQRLVERVAPRGAVQGERQHAGIEALEQRVVHAHPIAQTFLGARPLLARYARCAPTPARLRRAP